MDKNIEVRSFNVEFRNDPENRHIEGYASVFNKRSLDLGGFTEIIAMGAFDNVIENSDVKALLDHNPNRGILARSRNGQGSLSLSVDNEGLRYSFDSPHTSLGDEVIEGLVRGDYSQSSFAFTVAEEAWTKEDNGSWLRTIIKVDRLYDVSIVADPAYPDTSVAMRSLDAYKESLEKREEVQEEKNQEEVPAEEVLENVEEVKGEEIKEEVPVEETPVEQEEKRAEITVNDIPELMNDYQQSKRFDLDIKVKETGETIRGTGIIMSVGMGTDEIPETKEENNTPEVQEAEPKENRNNTQNKVNMKNFSLIQTINDVILNRGINEDAQNVIAMGAQEMRKSGLSYSGQIQLPVEERAAATDGAVVATVETQGQEIVATDKLNILGPLRGESILSKVGATFLTGLTGNISIPAYSGSTAKWKGEMVDAENGMGEFDAVELSPKRLTAYIDVSRQFLAQDSVGAEAMLMRDIVDAILAKLEKTVFGDEEGTNDKPEGLLYDAETVDPSYAQACEDEAAITDFRGEKVYVMSPAAKAAFKQTTISGNLSDLRLLMQDNEVNGYRVVSSSNVADGGYLFGDFSELVIAQWGAIDLTIDPYTLATKNAVRIVVNAFFDAKLRRTGAVIGAVIDSGESD